MLKGALGRSAAILIIAALGYVLLQMPLGSYIVDDAFIHLTFARNLSQGHGFSFNPGQPVYGITAPLWTLTLALIGLIHPLSPLVAKTLSIGCGLLTLPVFYRLGARLGLKRITAAYAALVWSVNVWLVRWAASGMEATLAVLLILLAIDAWVSSSPTCGWWWGLSVLVRPELALLFLSVIVLTTLNQDRRRVLHLAVPALLIVIPWLVYARLVFGSLLPNPWLIKSDKGLPLWSELTFNFLRMIKMLLASNGIEILIVIAILAILIYLRDLARLKTPVAIVLIVWIMVLPTFYLARGVFMQSRYLLPIIPALILAAFGGLEFLLTRQNPLGIRMRNKNFSSTGLLILAAVLATQQLILFRQVVLPHTAAFQVTLQALHRLADYIREETPRESVIAVGDVGLIGFYSERRILDLEGLVTREIIPFRQGRSLDKFIQHEDFLKAGKPDYFIDKTSEPERMTKINLERYHVLRVEPILGAMIDNAEEKWFYTLYCVD